MDELLVGIDMGTSATKAVVVDAGGRVVGGATRTTPFTAVGTGAGTAAGTRVETTVDTLQMTLAAVLQELGDVRRRVAAVGIAGMAECGTALGRSGEALGPVIAWHDPRGADTVSRLVERFGDDLSRRIGGPMRTVTSAAKLGWLTDHGVSGVVRWLGVPELGLRALTGSEVTEHSLAARTGCYDVGEHRWLTDVIAAVTGSGAAVGAAVFAPVRTAGDVMGVISAGGAAWSGLPAGIPVTLAGHDHLVGMGGCGASDTDLGNSVGTAECVVAISGRLPDVEQALARRVTVTVMPGGQRWGLLAGAARAGLVLGQVAGALGHRVEELDRMALASPAGDPSAVRSPAGDPSAVRSPAGDPSAVRGPAGDLSALASPAGDPSAVRSPAGDPSAVRGPAGDPSALGGGTPDLDALLAAIARGGPVGSFGTASADRASPRLASPFGGAPAGAVWRTILGALSTRTWDAVARLSALAVPVPAQVGSVGDTARLVVFGGGSHSVAWLDAKASVGWLPVWRSTTPEAVARGAALSAGVAAGWWPTPSAGPSVPLEEVPRPSTPVGTPR